MFVTSPGERSKLLLVSPRFEDHSTLRRILRHTPWELQGAFTAGEGQTSLHLHHDLISVVICELTLPDGDWKFLLRELDRVPIRPSFIGSTRIADERLWAEVLNLGAFDLLLASPFVAEEVLRVVESAWLAWNRAYGRTAIPRIGAYLARSWEDTPARVLTAGSHVQ
jgi:response regulator RpfG family c-di-GMP phosphodiesterase